MAGLETNLSLPNMNNTGLQQNESFYYYYYDDRPITFSEYWEGTVESKIYEALSTYIPPVLTIVGSTGNIVVSAVLLRKHSQQYSVYYYMVVLAIINTIMLYAGCGLNWIIHITHQPHIASRADWLCKFWQFAFNVVMYLSSWMIVAMTIDRFLTMWYPQKAQNLCTVFIAKFVTAIILVGLIVVSIHAMWTYEITQNGCSIDFYRQDFQTIVWPWIAATIRSYVPMVIVIICISFLAIGTCQSGRGDSDSQQVSLTFVTMCIAAAYITLELPTIIVNFMEYSYAQEPDWLHSSQYYSKRTQLYITKCICQTMRCIHYSVTFIIYFAVIPSLRTDFLLMLRQLAKRNKQTSIQEMQQIDKNGKLLPSAKHGGSVKDKRESKTALMMMDTSDVPVTVL